MNSHVTKPDLKLLVDPPASVSSLLGWQARTTTQPCDFILNDLTASHFRKGSLISHSCWSLTVLFLLQTIFCGISTLTSFLRDP